MAEESRKTPATHQVVRTPAPSAETLLETLIPLMVSVYRPTEGDRNTRWYEEGVARLLGSPGAGERESTGLHRYGLNHLRPPVNMLAEATTELLDAINQVGPLWQDRLLKGIEQAGRLKERFVWGAIAHMFAALSFLEDAQEVKE